MRRVFAISSGLAPLAAIAFSTYNDWGETIFDFYGHRYFWFLWSSLFWHDLGLDDRFCLFDTPLPFGHKKIHIQLVFVISLPTEVDFVGNTTTVNCVKSTWIRHWPDYQYPNKNYLSKVFWTYVGHIEGILQGLVDKGGRVVAGQAFLMGIIIAAKNIVIAIA